MEYFYQRVICKLYRIRQSIIGCLCTIYMRFKCWIWGVKLGNCSKFIGNMIIFRCPGSSIVIGDNCRFVSTSYGNFRGINHRCIFQTNTSNAKIRIGHNCGFSGVSLVCSESVIIGDDCLIGANVVIGDRDDHSDVYHTPYKPVEIKSGTWIGMNVCILKGVTIGHNTIIGANSVVTKSIPDNVIAAGNPCRVIKQR